MSSLRGTPGRHWASHWPCVETPASVALSYLKIQQKVTSKFYVFNKGKNNRGCDSSQCLLPAHLWGLLLLLVVIASRWARVRRRATLTSLRVQLCVRVAVRLPVVRIRGPRWETGPWWRSGATQSDQSKTRSGVQTGPWTETYRWQVKMQNMHRFAWCVFVHCMCVSADLFTLRLSVAFCASMRFIASAWLSSAHNCWPMATSSSYSFSPALHALLRLRTCREKKG